MQFTITKLIKELKDCLFILDEKKLKIIQKKSKGTHKYLIYNIYKKKQNTMNIFEVLKDGKLLTMDAEKFLNMKAIALRIFRNGELQWQHPAYEEFRQVIRNCKLKELLS